MNLLHEPMKQLAAATPVAANRNRIQELRHQQGAAGNLTR